MLILSHSPPSVKCAHPAQGNRILEIGSGTAVTITNLTFADGYATGTFLEDGGANNRDQRGFPRPADGNRDDLAVCDIGAFELQPEWLVALPVILQGRP